MSINVEPVERPFKTAKYSEKSKTSDEKHFKNVPVNNTYTLTFLLKTNMNTL